MVGLYVFGVALSIGGVKKSIRLLVAEKNFQKLRKKNVCSFFFSEIHGKRPKKHFRKVCACKLSSFLEERAFQKVRKYLKSICLYLLLFVVYFVYISNNTTYNNIMIEDYFLKKTMKIRKVCFLGTFVLADPKYDDKKCLRCLVIGTAW